MDGGRAGQGQIANGKELKNRNKTSIQESLTSQNGDAHRRLCACWCKTLPSETLQRLSSWISSILRTGAEDCRWREWCKVETQCKKHRHCHWLTIDGWHKSSPTGGVWLDLAHYMTTLVIKGGNGYFTIRRTTSVLLIVMVTDILPEWRTPWKLFSHGNVQKNAVLLFGPLFMWRPLGMLAMELCALKGAASDIPPTSPITWPPIVAPG